MIDERIFLGKPIDFKGKFKIYPPTINQVLDEEQFGIYKNLLLISQEEIEDQMVGEPDNYLKLTGDEVFPTPMEYLFQLCYQDKRIHKIALDAFKFFLHQDVSFIFEEKKILIGGIEQAIQLIQQTQDTSQLTFIEEEEYFSFQNKMRYALGEEEKEMPNPTMSLKMKRFKAKSRLRDKIKAQKGGGLSFGGSLAAICCMGINITPLNVGDLSYAAVRILTNTMQKKEKYEMDIKSLLAGADPKKIKPKYWLDEIDKK